VISANRHGLRVVSEIYILLSTERILAKEREQFPNWEPDALSASDFSSVCRHFFPQDVLLSETSFFICPSEAVRDDLVSVHGVAPDTTSVLPYGVNPSLLRLPSSPRRGRVLFVGSAELRKGIHYYAMAAEKVARRIPYAEFRVAGNVSSAIVGQPVCRHLNFLGRIPRNRIHEEYQNADIFVLPSLAEGSAEVIYEALAVGLPVITTKSAGSVVRDGVEGRIVPERDPDALASAIEELLEDRALRDRMAGAARKRAEDFTWERYGERLLGLLRTIK
jgi:glycosyltransferase involved in cell wall biosynthesis